MQLNLSQPEDFLGLGPAFSLDLVGRLAELRQHVFPFSPEIKSLVKQAFDRFYKLGAVPLSVSTLVFLLQTMLHGLQEQQLDTDHFLELGQYIESHLTDNLTIEDLSRACCISVSTLQHKFKDYFGRHPGGIHQLPEDRALQGAAPLREVHHPDRHAAGIQHQRLLLHRVPEVQRHEPLSVVSEKTQCIILGIDRSHFFTL